jgi:four helix bundle protein
MKNKKENILLNLSLKLAVEGAKLCKELQFKHRNFTTSHQIRGNTRKIGELVRESQQTTTINSHIRKLTNALKEVQKTEYLIQILLQTSNVEKKEFAVVEALLQENSKMLNALIKTAKSGLKN